MEERDKFATGSSAGMDQRVMRFQVPIQRANGSGCEKAGDAFKEK